MPFLGKEAVLITAHLRPFWGNCDPEYCGLMDQNLQLGADDQFANRAAEILMDWARALGAA